MKCKKILSLLLALVMLLGTLPMAFAADGTENTNCTVEIQYLYDGKSVANSWTASLAKGTDYKGTVNNPAVVGYEPKEATPVAGQNVTFTKEAVTLDIQNIQTDIIITVTYAPAIVNYTVKYFQQNVNDDNYALAETETLKGLTGETIAEISKSYDGFYQLPYNRDKIAADGSTVVEVYYDRNYYLMTFDLGGGYGVEPIYARYGAPIGEIGTPVRPGYTFLGWDKVIPDTMPAEKTSFAANWEASNANLTVVFWYENANDDGYSVAGFANVTNKNSGQTVTSEDYRDTNFSGRDDDHFTYNANMAETKTIAGDGSTVLNVYFTRNTYTITFPGVGERADTPQCGLIEHKHTHDECCTKTGWHLTCNHDKCPVGYEHAHSDNCYTMYTITAKYDSDISYVWETDPVKSLLDEGYVFQSSVTEKYYAFLEKMPGKDITMTKTKWSGATYTWHYYLEVPAGMSAPEGSDTKTDGSITYYRYHTTKVMKNSVSLTYDEDYFPITGYTQRDKTVPEFKNKVAYLYYTRNQYPLTFMNYGSEVSEKDYYYQQDISDTYFEPAYPDTLEKGAYVFAGWYDNPYFDESGKFEFEGATMPAGPVILYAKWAPVDHTVRVFQDNTLKEQIGETQTVPHGDFATAPADPTNGNYTFVGWFYMDNGVEKAFDFASMPVRRDLDIYAKWSSTVIVNYTIHYQLENGTPIADDTTGSALAGTTRTFDAKGDLALYEGYREGYFPKTKSHSLTLSAEGENTFTFVYVQKDAVPYTVRYLEKGTDKVLATEKTVPDNRKAVVTEYAVTVPGYMPEQYQQRLIVTVDGENVLTFYYVADTQHALVTVEHITVKNGVESRYSYSEYTGDIGTTYTESNLTNINGYVFDYATVNGNEWTAEGDPNAQLTGTGLHFVFYYEYNCFDVWYQSLGKTTTYDMVDSFSVTHKVHNGYLYGGLYTDQTFTTPLEDKTICGLGFAPVAGATYYVKEVPDAYLRPKIYYIYDRHDSNKVKQIYLVTAIDDMNYQQVGFDVNTNEHKQQKVSGDTVYESVIVEHYNNKWELDPKLRETLTLKSFFQDTLKQGGYLNIQKYSDYKSNPTHLDADYTMLPYFVTPDGVKVTGVLNRTVLMGNGLCDVPGGMDVEDKSVTSTTEKYTDPNANTLMLRSAFALTWEQPAATEYTITKVDGENTTTETVEAGNRSGQIAYAEKNGQLFAGWFMDSACTVPADFSDVQADMTVYAKYISAGAVDTNVTLLSKKNGSMKTAVTLNTDQLAEVGFVYSRNGEEGTVVTGDKTVKRPFLQWLTGKETQYQFSGSWSLNGLKNGDTFTVTPYWLTLDGTLVYGAADTYVCYWNFVIQR